MEPSLKRWRRYFEILHLPPLLRDVAAPFNVAANLMIERFDSALQDFTEADMALRKLCEAKDCAVRSFIL